MMNVAFLLGATRYTVFPAVIFGSVHEPVWGLVSGLSKGVTL